MGRAGRERAVQLFDWESKVTRILEIYEQVLRKEDLPVATGASQFVMDAMACLPFCLHAIPDAVLLFSAQPMVAKMVLPLLGGSPSVWDTCMVFFQAALLAGYAYAHATTTWLGVRRQAMVHAGLSLVPLFMLPFGISAEQGAACLRGESNRLAARTFVGSVGLPFFIVSTSAPLLQRWFASTGHPAAPDPYFLYGASNLGSLLALLAYPLLIEPLVRLTRQKAAGPRAMAFSLCSRGLCGGREPIDGRE